jgi:hypothetical protein
LAHKCTQASRKYNCEEYYVSIWMHTAPTQHLYVLSYLLFFVTLGQWHNATLQQVAKGNQGRTSIVLFCHGTKNWIIQENWGAWVHPARKDTNSELQRLSIQLLARIPNSLGYPLKSRDPIPAGRLSLKIYSEMHIFP